MAQRSAKDNDYQSYRVNPAYESDHEYQTTIKPSVQPQSYDQNNIYDVPDDNDKPRNTSRRLLCIITVTIVIVLLLTISGAVVGYLLAKPDTSIERMSTLPPTSEDVSDTSTERMSTLPPTSEGPVGKPIWTTWLSWSNCDVTCGRGVQQRSRTCVSQHNEKTCVGNETEQQNCAVWKCPDRDYICPYGDLNDNFDACECETDILQGLVTDENNRPLSHATVAYASRPYIALAITNSTGMFQIRGVCATSQPILVRKPMFTTIEANTTVIDSTSSYLHVELQRIELPFIIGQPEDKIRQTGESVKFCCIAESNTPITKYEWFRNSDIIESANANNESHLIHNLTVEDSGQYTCRVHNGGGVVYSEPAILTIASTGSNTGCNSEPRSKLIRLPSDCVQPETNKAEFDVGSCGQTECYGTKMDQTSCSDRQEEYHCCQPVQSEMVNLTCASYTLPVSRVKSCGCGECASQIRKIIGRVISAESGDDLDYIGVYYNSTLVAATHDGIFIYETATQARKITLTLKDEWNPRRVMTTTVVFEINNDLVTHRVIKMKTIPDPIPMESTSVENCLPLFGDGSNAVAELVIAPNSMYTRDGKMYSGPFNAAVINIDMRNVTDAESAPGDFTTVDVEGNVAQLRSFGMVAFAFTDATGNKLAIGGSSEVRVKPEMIPQCKTDENGDCDTSLWVLNEKTGSWEMASSLSQSNRQRRQNGLGSLDGNMEVIEYRWYNIDAFDESERCWAKVVPYDSNNFSPRGLLPYNFMVTSIIEEEGIPFLRRAVVTGRTTFGNIGVCVPQACDMSNPKDSRFTTLLSATFNGNMLLPAESNSSNISLDPIDISNLNYRIVTDSDETKLQMKPVHSIGGPIFLGKYSGFPGGACNEASTESKHFQFYCETCDNVLCNTFESVALSPPARTYLTYYPLLPRPLLTGQTYCFIGLRIYTSVPVVQMIAKSEVGSFMPPENINQGFFYGSREVLARKSDPNNDFIDACMEFKCSGEIFDKSIGSNIEDTTKVTIEVKGAGDICSVSPVAEDFMLSDVDGSNAPTLRFTFNDPETYGRDQGLHRISEFNNIPICTNDENSPQTADTGHCMISQDFVPAVEITCQ